MDNTLNLLWFQSEEVEKRSIVKPKNECVKNRNWAKKDGMIPVKKAPVIKVEKRAEEYFQESDNSKTKSDEDSKKRDIGTSLEKPSIKSGNILLFWWRSKLRLAFTAFFYLNNIVQGGGEILFWVQSLILFFKTTKKKSCKVNNMLQWYIDLVYVFIS